MQIDWLTVAAQIINFLVLVWLLKRFLYVPITRAMERREMRIVERLREAEVKKEEAESEARAYRNKQDELERQRDRLLAEAREAAEEERKALEREAREDVAVRKGQWLAQLEADRVMFLRDLRQRSTEQFYRLAQRALDDLADADLEEKIAHSFIKQLEALDKGTRAKLAEKCAETRDTVTIRSRFDLSAGTKRNITKTIHQRIHDKVNIDYETDKVASCGIELRAGGETVAWNLASYLEGLEKAVQDQISGVVATAEGRAEG
jgi:F-type H+-transporting ATPase subunit b